jgi:hypothetical protein
MLTPLVSTRRRWKDLSPVREQPVPNIPRRAFLTASALAVPAAWALGTSAIASAATRAADDGLQALGLSWYDITNGAVSAAQFAEPVTQSRTWAVSWLAAAQAVSQSADPTFQSAAFAQALHDTLVFYVPSQQATLDTALASTLASLPGGQALQAGVSAGAGTAASLLAARANDGLDTASVDIPFTPPPPAPGIFQLTPPLSRPAIRAGQGNGKAFLLKTNDQFDPGPPLNLSSPLYQSALTEVENIGAAGSPRTAEQTEVANFWYPSLNFAYVQILRAVLVAKPSTLTWQAKLVAAFNVITTDAQISIYNAKYKYLFWRPYTAITTGSFDQDPAWTSFWAAPQHPEYPSGHGGVAGSADAVLTAFLGPQSPAPIAITSPDAPGVTRTYTNWLTITEEVINARVWEGVHFRTSDITGAAQGAELAIYELLNLRSLGI